MITELVTKTVGHGSYEDLNNEEIIAAVARHGKIKNDNGGLVVYLMEHKHYSPLQHVFFGFKIQTSRAISAQTFRHRSLNFQETSQRYDKILSFEPIELRKQCEKNRQSSTDIIPEKTLIIGDEYSEKYAEHAILDVLNHITVCYNDLIKAGVAKECARMILPMCSTTTIHVSGTLRDLLAFLNIRCDEHAQKEIRDIANAMGEELENELPEVFARIDWRNGLFM